jgi:hypothetical protein
LEERHHRNKGGMMRTLLAALMCIVLATPAGWARQGTSTDTEGPAGAETNNFNSLIATLYGWLKNDTPVEHSSWTEIKARHR